MPDDKAPVLPEGTDPLRAEIEREMRAKSVTLETPDGTEWVSVEIHDAVSVAERLVREEREQRPRRFPIQPERGRPSPTTIPWEVADLAYSQYVAQFGNGQSLERLAERSGFSVGEMDMFLPDWESRCVAIEGAVREATERWGHAKNCECDLAYPSYMSEFNGRPVRHTVEGAAMEYTPGVVDPRCATPAAKAGEPSEPAPDVKWAEIRTDAATGEDRTVFTEPCNDDKCGVAEHFRKHGVRYHNRRIFHSPGKETNDAT